MNHRTLLETSASFITYTHQHFDDDNESDLNFECRAEFDSAGIEKVAQKSISFPKCGKLDCSIQIQLLQSGNCWKRRFFASLITNFFSCFSLNPLFYEKKVHFYVVLCSETYIDTRVDSHGQTWPSCYDMAWSVSFILAMVWSGQNHGIVIMEYGMIMAWSHQR